MNTLLRFESAGIKWWQKPLVRHGSRVLPAELVVLLLELSTGESGAWLNSRGLDSGVTDVVSTDTGALKTKRVPLPAFVAVQLRRLYREANVKRGCPDLVIWNQKIKRMRLVEVKCPHWDRPSQEQKFFIHAAESAGIEAKIVEWEFGEEKPGYSADIPFEFAEDGKFFALLLCGPGESIVKYQQLFDLRPPPIKRKEFNRERSGLLKRPIAKHGRRCMLAYSDICDASSGYSVDHIIPLSSNELNKRLRRLQPIPRKKVRTQSFGSNHIFNLVVACNKCNGHKKHRFLEQHKIKELLGLKYCAG